MERAYQEALAQLQQSALYLPAAPSAAHVAALGKESEGRRSTDPALISQHADVRRHVSTIVALTASNGRRFLHELVSSSYPSRLHRLLDTALVQTILSAPHTARAILEAIAELVEAGRLHYAASQQPFESMLSLFEPPYPAQRPSYIPALQAAACQNVLEAAFYHPQGSSAPVTGWTNQFLCDCLVRTTPGILQCFFRERIEECSTDRLQGEITGALEAWQQTAQHLMHICRLCDGRLGDFRCSCLAVNCFTRSAALCRLPIGGRFKPFHYAFGRYLRLFIEQDDNQLAALQSVLPQGMLEPSYMFEDLFAGILAGLDGGDKPTQMLIEGEAVFDCLCALLNEEFGELSSRPADQHSLPPLVLDPLTRAFQRNAANLVGQGLRGALLGVFRYALSRPRRLESGHNENSSPILTLGEWISELDEKWQANMCAIWIRSWKEGGEGRKTGGIINDSDNVGSRIACDLLKDVLLVMHQTRTKSPVLSRTMLSLFTIGIDGISTAAPSEKEVAQACLDQLLHTFLVDTWPSRHVAAICLRILLGALARSRIPGYGIDRVVQAVLDRLKSVLPAVGIATSESEPTEKFLLTLQDVLESEEIQKSGNGNEQKRIRVARSRLAEGLQHSAEASDTLLALLRCSHRRVSLMAASIVLAVKALDTRQRRWPRPGVGFLAEVLLRHDLAANDPVAVLALQCVAESDHAPTLVAVLVDRILSGACLTNKRSHESPLQIWRGMVDGGSALKWRAVHKILQDHPSARELVLRKVHGAQRWFGYSMSSLFPCHEPPRAAYTLVLNSRETVIVERLCSICQVLLLLLEGPRDSMEAEPMLREVLYAITTPIIDHGIALIQALQLLQLRLMACAMTRAANNDVSIAQACEQLTRARHTMLAMYSRSSHSQIEGLAKTLLSWRPVPSLRPDEAQVL